ncbi:DUF2141 domain-containing protein [uncultured Polaribacter sp.]|uniref:DUF2141 domain-containing protein n=1 Tax=uncultured Polaribacter sp. TaxID=174711 RepID=UPI0026209E64|nr:DUF2141 domain-containing protein [uncultured Polaribacter sp.]
MKKIILIITIVFSGLFTTNAQEAEKFSITVNITGLASNKGKVLLALYNKQENFLNKRFKGGMSKITDKKATYVFEGVVKGEYAISFFHDENNNNKMDTNFVGIPKEDYGCSNNATGFVGPPKYKDAKFQLLENKEISIEI